MNGNDHNLTANLKMAGFILKGGGGGGERGRGVCQHQHGCIFDIFNMKSVHTKQKPLRHNQEKLTLCVKSREKKVHQQ